MEFTCTKDDYIDVLENYNGEMTIKLTGQFDNFFDFVSDVNNYCIYPKQITLDLSEAEADTYYICECPQIVSIIFPKDLRGKKWSVYGCENLTEIELPEYSNTVRNPFNGCPNLNYIYIPNNVYFDAYFDDNGGANPAFYYIKKVFIEDNNPNYTIIDDIYLIDKRRNALVRVLASEFDEDEEFSLTIPESVTYIAPYAFAFLDGLTKLTLHENITGVAVAAFSNAKNLAEICNMPKVPEFPNNCFEYCHSLSKVEIPDSVKSIGKDCFGSCDSLTEIEIPESVNLINSYAFRSTGLVKLVVPGSVKEMGTSCFTNCPDLKTVYFLPGIPKVGLMALDGCDALEQVTFPKYMLCDPEIKNVFMSSPDDSFPDNVVIIFR